MLTWLILLALIWPLLWLVRIAVTARLLLGLEFRRGRVVPHGPEGISAHLREAGQGCVAQLEAAGFQLLGGWRIEQSEDGALDEFAIVLTRPGTPVRAVVRGRSEVERAADCWVSLRTTTAFGIEWVTVSYAPEQLMPLPAGIVVEVVANASVDELLQRHLARIESVAADAWQCVDIEGAALREQYLCNGVFEHFRASGMASERAPNVLSFRVGSAFARARALMRRAAALKKREKKGRAKETASSVAPALSPESQLAFDLQQYRQIGAVMNGKMSLRTKTIIGVASFLLFAAVLGWRYSPVVAVTLLVALVVHEGGHLLGMRWFGFRDTQLLFIPFLGGAAIGHDEKVLSPWKHIVIVLLGPLPGLFAGIVALALASGGGAGWLEEAAFTVVFLNAFNLLPVLPLDGGQIVDFAFASRFPRARVLFVALSAVILLGLALLLDGVQLLLIAGIATLLRLPLEWRLAGLRREVQSEYPNGGDEESILRRLLIAVRAPAWSKVPVIQRLQHVRGLQLVLRMPKAGLGTMAFALAGYSSPLWLGAPLAVWAAHRQGEALVRAAEANVAAAGLELDKKTARPSATVPDEQNAAAFFTKAESLSAIGVPRDDASRAEVLSLLRAAAAKPALVLPDEPSTPQFSFKKHTRGLLVRELTTAAQECLRYRQPDEAAKLALEALRLCRLLDAGSVWASWEIRRQIVDSCWSTVEEVVAAGVTLSPPMLAELKTFTDERHEIACAASLMPAGLLREARDIFELANSDEQELWQRAILAVYSVSSGAGRARAETLNQAVALHRHLQGIEKGTWPVAPALTEFHHTDESLRYVAQLADLVARLRQAHAALLVIERKSSGAKPAGLEALGLPSAQIAHPFTRETMRWTRRGSVEVLAFGSTATARLFGAVSSEDESLVWRLPAL